MDLLTPIAPRVLGLPGPALRLFAGPPPVSDEGHPMDPRTWAMVTLHRRLALPDAADLTVLEARAANRRKAGIVGGGPIPVLRVEDLQVPGGDGPIPARLYQHADHTPLLVYLHGGGWVVGGLETHDGLCRRLCRAAEVTVLSVDYRLAPEHRFPCGLEDALAAWGWAVEHAAALRADPARMALGGDSAGGNLAAAACLVLRSEGLRLPDVQLLLYPATDLHRRGVSHRTFAEGHLLTARGMDWYIGHYVRGEADKDDVRASPLYAEDLSSLPRAVVRTAGFDPLRDEGRRYAERLAAAGVEVDCADEHGLVHGWANMTGVLPEARRALGSAARRLAVALRR